MITVRSSTLTEPERPERHESTRTVRSSILTEPDRPERRDSLRPTTHSGDGSDVIRKVSISGGTEDYRSDYLRPASPSRWARRTSSVATDLSDSSWLHSRNAPAPVFVDAEAMKAKLRQAMVKPEYDVGNFYRKNGWCQMVARSALFERTTLFVIAINAVWIAVDTDLNPSAVLIDAHPVFQIAEHFFCIYFAWEWSMRFGAFEHKRNGLKDAWFIFDSMMVFLMVAETWVVSIIFLALGGASATGLGGNTGTLRLLRLLRLSRMARMAKLLRSFPELLILIKGMASATRSVFVTLLLLFILIYVFSIAFRQLTDGSEVGNQYFPHMGMSIHTLWIDGTLLDDPGNLVGALSQESVVLVAIFYFFVLLAALTVMNMLIGVLCEVVSAVAAMEREQITMATVKDGFMEIIKRGGIDTDGDNQISRQEFVEILDDPDAVKLLTKVGVDVYAFVDLADFLFQADEGQDEQPMTFIEFMEVVLSLRGTNSATVKDIVDLRKFIKTQFNFLDQKAENRQMVLRQSLEEEILKASMQAGRIRGSQAACVLPNGPIKEMKAGSPGQSKLWLSMAELQGVLSAAERRIEQHLESLPPPDTSWGMENSHPARACAWGVEEAGARSGSLLVAPLRLGECRPTSAIAPVTATSGTPAPPADWSPRSLPGMVDVDSGGNGATGWVESTRQSRCETRGQSRCETRGQSRSGAGERGMDKRLTELRAELQQLVTAMSLAKEKVCDIQDLL